MKYFITKYALTTGIYEVEGEEIGKGIIEKLGTICPDYYHWPDWHTTLETAIVHAEHMQSKKIRALKKQIEKLEVLKFEGARK